MAKILLTVIHKFGSSNIKKKRNKFYSEIKKNYINLNAGKNILNNIIYSNI